MSQGAYRILLLDIGHVLVSLNYKIITERMRSLTGLEPAQLQTILRGEGLVRHYETGEITDTEFYEEVCRRAGTRIPWPAFVEAWNSILGDPLVPDEVLAALSRSIRLWAVSNTNSLHFDFMSAHFNFVRHFEGFVLSYEEGAVKPDPRIFLCTLAKTRAEAQEVLFVDDQEANVRAAANLGIDGFQFLGLDHFIAEMKSRQLLPID